MEEREGEHTMKNIFATLLTLCIVLSLAACGGTKTETTPASSGNDAQIEGATTSEVNWPGNATINVVVPYGAGGAPTSTRV